ncbi:MAG: hypothetical protein CMH48_07865 [Muricauda sp.]|nr:hypothetical protein [Allomuricauda sp.]MBC30749.1 hypothetical protein [Allomuricauda sp.]|tara:strand:- start:435 stop:740 length:306 start_codon:yes stop_codon:yes gene_type:complete
MEYKKEYRNIGFRVFYNLNPQLPKALAFAAQPYELLEEMDKGMTMMPNLFLVHGLITKAHELEVTFNGFRIRMNQDLHSRLGLLYEMAKKEYRNVVLKKAK